MVVVAGSLTPGFAAVEEAFARSDIGRGGAAFSAYVEGEKVVDLWAGDARPGVAWGRDTMTTAMSATKGFAALCAHILHDRGLLDIDAPVARYWPEYAQAGKEKTLVRHILNHTSGMLCFQDPGDLLDWSGNGWDDYDEIARRIAASPPAWEPGTRIGYHAISIGWLIQELVRRITGTTVGSFFAREVAEPLRLSIFIGTPEPEQARLADQISDPPAESSPLPEPVLALFKQVSADPASHMSQAGIHMHGGTISSHNGFFNLPKVRGLEVPAANGSVDARSLARMYAMLAQGGELDGVRIVTPESINVFGTKSFSGPNALWPDSGLPEWLTPPEMRYALGYEGDFGQAPAPWRFGPTHESFGHLGAGGQVGFADPVRHVAIGFVRSHLGADWSVSNSLVEVLYTCL
ncbi:serine hydrolase domain-containing protein [Nonomuraea basaltis]|uniref:serine hydrolase domain-containing protein n=1 Tax=Nonomuraea basaltis TaxID=2495887 RepID=UPI00110C520D|nr:serine hydrolase domain-containing protein [Nonomuraea basaltis]TMR91012.1 beta-lactamase family protein [Nonomuraea basaltis]